MWILTSFSFILLSLHCISGNLEGWQIYERDVCTGPIELKCPSPEYDLVIHEAIYHPGRCSCLPCTRGTLSEFSALEDVRAQCPGNGTCIAHLNPYRALTCDCLKKLVYVEYRCIKRESFQWVCGDEAFGHQSYGHIVNDKYPETREAKECLLVFRVGENKTTTIVVWEMEIPDNWNARHCNYSTCHDLEPETHQHYELKGDSFIRITGKGERRPVHELQLKLHFEYEVQDISLRHYPIESRRPKNSHKDIGVVKVHQSINAKGVAFGTTFSFMFIVLLSATTFVYRKKYLEKKGREKKMFEEIQENMYFSEVYQRRKSLQVADDAGNPMKNVYTAGETET